MTKERETPLNASGAIFSVPQFFGKWTKIDARRDSWTEYARHLNGTTSRRRYRFKGIQKQEWVDEGPFEKSSTHAQSPRGIEQHDRRSLVMYTVSDTQWYLEGSPELMREAMQRLQQRWEERP